MEVVIHALRPFKHWVIGLWRAAAKSKVFTLNVTHLDLLQSIFLQLGLSLNEFPIWCPEDEQMPVRRASGAGDGLLKGRSSISMASGTIWWGYRAIS